LTGVVVDVVAQLNIPFSWEKCTENLLMAQKAVGKKETIAVITPKMSFAIDKFSKIIVNCTKTFQNL